MLRLRDFSRLPQLDMLIEQLVHYRPGLIVVAGLDPRPHESKSHLPAPVPDSTERLLSSGRAAIFRVLIGEILSAHPGSKAVVVTQDREAMRVSPELRRRVYVSRVENPSHYSKQITAAAHRQPDLLVVDRLDAETVQAVLNAARGGGRVLSQLDTAFRGADVAQALLELGASAEQLAGLTWVIAVQRVALLCPRCKEPTSGVPALVDDLRRHYPHLSGWDRAESGGERAFFRPVGCDACRQTGRRGDVAVFDVFRADYPPPDLFDQPSVLPLAACVLELALQGSLSLGDVLHLEAEQLRRTHAMLTASERALAEANGALQRKLAELEAANRVLEHRTEALISLQDIGQALIATTDLHDLADRVCHRACDLCGADRAILYLARPGEEAEILAVRGWDRRLVGRRLAAGEVFGAAQHLSQSRAFVQVPPGVEVEPAARGDLHAGLNLPLAAQGEQIGLMIVQATRKPGFTPGETALLQTLSAQAVLAIQRAGLINQLVQKERMERELELARQVQQSVLPRVFPQVPGYTFAAHNEPARQVGGDLYDVIDLGDGCFGLVIADVSDKGMPAALYMALTRSLILAEAQRERSPRAVLASVNRLLLQLGEANMFVTVFYGVVDTASRRLTYARAGHDRPLLLREGAELVPTASLLGGQGLFLGILSADELSLTEERIDLLPGDRLILYTDGLTDALSPNGDLYDLERLCKCCTSHADIDPPRLCEAVFADLAEFRGTAEQFDDMTMLVVAVDR